MNAAAVKEYLRMCIELEKQADTQNFLISGIKREIRQLAIPNNYQVPTLKKFSGNSLGNILFGIFFTLFALILGGIIIWPSAWFLTKLGKQMLREGWFGWIEISLCVLGLLVGVFVLWIGTGGIPKLIKDHKEVKAKNKEEEESYNQALLAYNQALEDDAKRVSQEQIKQAALRADLNNLQSALTKTKNCLKQLYGKGVLYSKYRNYACVCSLYEYFDSGRCTRLEGHEGAYNILESEMRLNRIITQTNQILSKLDEIKENQELLYDSIQESNRKADKLLASCQDMSNQLVGIQAQGEELNSRIAQLQTTSDLNLYLNACSTLELDSIRRANRIAQ